MNEALLAPSLNVMSECNAREAQDVTNSPTNLANDSVFVSTVKHLLELVQKCLLSRLWVPGTCGFGVSQSQKQDAELGEVGPPCKGGAVDQLKKCKMTKLWGSLGVFLLSGRGSPAPPVSGPAPNSHSSTNTNVPPL